MTDNDDYRDSDVLARRQQAPNRTPSVPQIWWKVGCALRQRRPPALVVPLEGGLLRRPAIWLIP